MKNRIIALSFLLASVLTVNAQQERVSKQLYASAYKIATDSKEDVNVRKAASFKVDAITYLNTRTLSALVDTTKQLFTKDIAHLNAQLDSMAYYMHEYVNLFTKEYARADKQKRKSKFSRYSVMQVLITHSTMTLIRILFWYTSIVRTILLSSPSIPTGLKHWQK